ALYDTLILHAALPIGHANVRFLAAAARRSWGLRCVYRSDRRRSRWARNRLGGDAGRAGWRRARWSLWRAPGPSSTSGRGRGAPRSEEHTSELQSRENL